MKSEEKFCVNCKHFLGSMMLRKEDGACAISSTGKFDPVTGKPEGPLFCFVFRMPQHKCGPEGKLYEGK